MSYDLIDALKDERDFIKQIRDQHKEKLPDAKLWLSIYNFQIQSLDRVIGRYADGIDYQFVDTGDGWRYNKVQTNRHLEREFPEVAESAKAHRELVEQAEVMKKIKDG